MQLSSQQVVMRGMGALAAAGLVGGGLASGVAAKRSGEPQRPSGVMEPAVASGMAMLGSIGMVAGLAGAIPGVRNGFVGLWAGAVGGALAGGALGAVFGAAHLAGRGMAHAPS